MSVYCGELTKKVVGESTMKVMKAFPQLSTEFFQVLSNRIKEHNFSNERLIAAVNHVIDTCVYPVPTIAQFISYDQRVKLHTYDDVTRMLNNNPEAFKSYRPVRVPNNVNRPMYAHISDIEKYSLESWKK